MQSGLFIEYEGRQTKFWYSCTRAKIKEVLAGHLAHWRSERVATPLGEVQRDVPVSIVRATFCTGWTKDEAGADVMVNPEPLDVAAVIG